VFLLVGNDSVLRQFPARGSLGYLFLERKVFPTEDAGELGGLHSVVIGYSTGKLL